MPRESTIQIYRSTTASNTPSLTAGEMAINIPDRKLFVGGTAGNIVFLDQSSVVTSVNSLTGAVTNVATTNTANTFTQTQSFAGGLTATGITAVGSVDTFGNFRFWYTDPEFGNISYTLVPSYPSPVGTSATLTLPNKSGTVALASEVVTSVNSLTGAITNVARTNAAQSFTGVQTFSNGISVAFGATFNSVATNGIATFTGLATANGGITASHLYVTNGATFASRIQGVGATFTGTVEVDTGLILPNNQNITSAVTTFNGASGAVTFAVPLASATVTGAASFGNEFVVSAAGAVSLTANYVKSFNGSTGAVAYAPPVATTSVTGVASFNSTYFSVAAGAVSLATAYQVTGDTAVAGTGITVSRSNNAATITNNGVLSINSLTGAITLTQGSNITITPSGNTLTIASTASGGGGATTSAANTWTALQTFSAGISSAGATFGGQVNCQSNTIYQPTLRYYNEPTSSPTISAGTLTLDLSTSQIFTVSLNADVTTFSITNTPATASRGIGFTLIFTADGTARTVTWGSAVKWAGATAPTLTSANTKRDVLSFLTTDAGTTWLGFVGGQNY